jgi:hypothetical protein
VADALPEVNEILLQGVTPEQREILVGSPLDEWLRDAERDADARPVVVGDGGEPSLDPFIPRRGDGLMLSASDIDTYRICPLKYKFARVFRIPQEPTIHQRFGIAMHQVLERYHTSGAQTLEELRDLYEAAWRRAGFGDHANDLVAEGHRCGASADRVRRDWDGDRSQAHLVDVRAADRGRLDAQQHVGLAGGWDGDVIEPDVAAGVPADRSHAGCQPISAWRSRAWPMSSSAIRR